MASFLGALNDISNATNTNRRGGTLRTIDDNGKPDACISTAISLGVSEISFWEKLTCLYDKNWEYDPRIATTPICMFAIKSVKKQRTAEVGTKRVIMYETGKSDISNAKRQSMSYYNNIRAISDNVVVQPAKYDVEAFIPNSLYGIHLKQAVSRLGSIIDFMSEQYGGDGFKSAMNVVQGISTGVNTTINILQNYQSLMDNITGMFGESGQSSTININSLDAMSESGHVVLFKKWTGMDYSYGVLTNLELKPNPEYMNCIEASFTLQEVPVLNISYRSGDEVKAKGKLESIGNTLKNVSLWTGEKFNLALASPFIKLTGVQDEAGAVGSTTKGGGSFFGMLK